MINNIVSFILIALFLTGCPKQSKETLSIEEKERKEALEELMGEDFESFDEVPENDEEELELDED